MIISQRKKFLFIHIPKNGGTSIRHHLRWRVLGARTFKPCKKHGFVADAREQLGEQADEFFTFAVVRNPWDRMVSWYSMIKARTTNPTWRSRLTGPTRNTLWLYVAETAQNFDDFILKCTDPDKARRLLYNQLDFLTDRNEKVCVNFVARFEQLDEDMPSVFEKIGLPKTRMPHRNGSRHRHYSEYYTDETRDLVAQRYSRDISHFGFRFEDCRT